MYAHNIIEIIGPPGVGKTTIYNSLCRTWEPVCNWTYQNALQRKKPDNSNFKAWVQFLASKLFRKHAIKSSNIDFGLRFIKENEALASFCWDYLSEIYKYDIDKRFRLAHLMFTDFCKYQFILENKIEKPCIINEGLMQKSIFVDDDEVNLFMQLNQYISLLPLPSAVVNIKIDNSNVIVDRILHREKVIASHLGKNEEDIRMNILKWQLILNSIVEIVTSKGVKIIEVDGERPIVENVKYIKQELNMN